MKTKLTIVSLAFLAASFSVNAQESQECLTTGSIFVESAKVKNYEAAKAPFKKLLENCPNWSLALYQYGERLYKADLDKAATDAEKKAIAKDLITLYQMREQYFGAKTKDGENLADIAQVMYDYGIGTKEEQYNAFAKAWDTDQATFKSAKSLYTYFSLLVDIQAEGKKTLQDVFDSYDSVQEKITNENNDLATRIEPLIKKQEDAVELTAKEKKLLRNAEINLKAYSTVAGSIDSKLGVLADCDNLIPLYQKDFEEKKDDIDWIKKAAGRMSGKDCTSDPLFIKLVEQLDRLAPSADTKLYLGQLEKEKGNMSKAMVYYKESAEMQTDPKKQYIAYYRIAEEQRRSGSYGAARASYNKALQANPSAGSIYLKIAAMYAASANNCGNSVFDKRAVYWLAADTAARAGRVNPSIASTANATAASYRAKAPDKAMIFSDGKAGQTVRIGCWIGASVKVPNL